MQPNCDKRMDDEIIMKSHKLNDNEIKSARRQVQPAICNRPLTLKAYFRHFRNFYTTEGVYSKEGLSQQTTGQ